MKKALIMVLLAAACGGCAVVGRPTSAWPFPHFEDPVTGERNPDVKIEPL